jgi:hypothetical protein
VKNEKSNESSIQNNIATNLKTLKVNMEKEMEIIDHKSQETLNVQKINQ